MKFSKKQIYTLNIILILSVCAIFILNIVYFQTPATVLGAFTARTLIITVAIWFITLIVPKRFKIYKLISSSSFILLIPIVLLLSLTYSSYVVRSDEGYTFTIPENWKFPDLLKYHQKIDFIQKLNNDIAYFRIKLPIKIDAITELFKVDFNNNQLKYYYQLVNLTEQQIQNFNQNLPVIKTTIISELKLKGCNDLKIKEALAHNIYIYYIYELNNQIVINYSLTKTDCNQ